MFTVNKCIQGHLISGQVREVPHVDIVESTVQKIHFKFSNPIGRD